MAKTFSRWTLISQPQPVDTAFQGLAEPITKASTIVFDSIAQLRERDWRDKSRYSYGLQGTPVTRRLEEKLALIDQARHALLFPSGLNAICLTMMALLRPGDALLMPRNSYGPAMAMAEHLVEAMDVRLHLYDPTDTAELTLPAGTKLVWVESPGSMTMEISDLPAIARVAHAHGAVVAADTTWSAGIACDPFALGADVCVHALTKYQSGGSDLLMGAITTNDDGLHDRIYELRTRLGIGVSPDDCYLVLRSLPHMRLRYLAQDRSAREIAGWLAGQPCVATVLHPAFATCPGHAIWTRDFSAAASIFSVVIHGDPERIEHAIEALQLFRLGVSWGGPTSLALPMRRRQLGRLIEDDQVLVRLYIGLEDTEDLLADLAQAFAILD
jgi:cystathionine beta-lyase